MHDLGLGRRHEPDERDGEYPILSLLGDIPPASTREWRYWQGGWHGDQGATSQCVGYSWLHWLESGPITQPGPGPIVPPETVYTEAQLIDEWPGEDYDGTSVRAGAKVLQARGFIESYHWAFDLDTLVEAILEKGPVVVGTNWYEDMFYPDEDRFVRIGGRLVGGHAYLLNGVSRKKAMFRKKGSWGWGWGRRGQAYITFEDMERLINEDGEICLAVERRGTRVE